MKARKFLICALAAGTAGAWSIGRAGLPPVPDPLSEAQTETAAPAPAHYGRVPRHFIRNDGQIAPEVLYYMKGSRGTVYLTAEEIVFDFVSGQPATPDRDLPPGEDPRPEKKPDPVSRLVFRLRFLGAVSKPAVEGEEELPGKINYFIGPRENWRTGIPTYEKVVYRGLYPGIDLSIGFRDDNLAYRLTAAPGSDPGVIALGYSGVEGLEIDSAGGLIVLTKFGGFRTPAPKAYQEVDGRPAEREAYFILHDETTAGLELPGHDPAHYLVIEF